MKKKLLFLLLAIPFVMRAQVPNPETAYTLHPQTGFTATVDIAQSASFDGSKAVDGINTTYWETKWNPAPHAPLPHWIAIDMQTTLNVAGIYIVDRNNQGNSPKTCTVSTSPDGTTWTQQGGTFTLPYNGTFGKIILNFPAPVSCRYYRINVTANQAAGNQVTNLAETGAVASISTPDPTAYDRSFWTVAFSSQETSGEGAANGRAAQTIDRDANTFWSSKWSAPHALYPHTLTYDMKQVQAVNRLYYIQRNHVDSRAVEGMVSFSDDGIIFGLPIPVTFEENSNKNFIDLPSLQYHRFFRITITKNVYARNNPLNVTNASYYATTMAEVGANLNQSLSDLGLLYFKALDVNNGAVRMDWSTAFENGSSRFDITRSTDGVNFTTIGSVNAAGTSTSQLRYNFTDNAAPAGTVYYQMQAVNTSGAVIYSDIVSVVSGTTYSSTQPANLNLVYFVPNDVEYIPDYQRRLSELMLWGQDFYAKNMENQGYGYRPFGMFKNAAGDRVKIITIFGTKSKDSYPYSGGAGAMQAEINAYFAAHPDERTSEHTLVIIPRYGFNGATPTGGPFYGLGKWCFALDYEEMDIVNLPKTDAVGTRFSVWYGGMLHELGHGLNLPHNRQLASEINNPNKGMALMWAGNDGRLGKPNQPVFLTAADCAILNGNQLFNNNTETYYGPVNARFTKLKGEYSSALNAIVVSGEFVSDIPAENVAYYNDPNVNNEGTGVNRDYNAITWASAVVNGNSFYIEMPVNELVYTTDYVYELKIKLVHTNGTITEVIHPYQFVNGQVVIDLNFEEKKELGKHGWTVAGFSSEETGGEGAVNGRASSLIDSDLSTFWHSRWTSNATSYPHDVTIDMGRAQEVKGLSFLQRSSLQRAVKDFEILTSDDGVNFTSQGNYVAEKKGLFQYFDFASLQTFRYFKVIAKSAWDGLQFASFAELGLYHDGNYAPTFTAPADITICRETSCAYDADESKTGSPTQVWDDYDSEPTVSFTDVTTGGSACTDETIITRTWKAADDDGGYTEKVQTITVKPLLSGTIADVYAVNPGGNANTIYLGYGPTSLTLQVQATGGTAPYTYAWSNGSTTESLVVNPSAAGTYTYTVVVTDALGCEITVTKQVSVIDIHCGNDKVYICHAAGNSGHSNDLCILKTAVGDHLAHGCRLGTCSVPITSARGAQQVVATNLQTEGFAVQAYPNPTASEFFLRISAGSEKPVNVRVFDINGKLLRVIRTSAGTISFGNELKTGIYTVEVVQDKNKKILKLIKL